MLTYYALPWHMVFLGPFGMEWEPDVITSHHICHTTKRIFYFALLQCTTPPHRHVESTLERPLNSDPWMQSIGSNGSTTVAHASSCWEAEDPAELRALEAEGRVVVTHHGPFVVFNVYGPALSIEERMEERFAFKLRFFEVRGGMA